jgi:hypothetical protein
VPDRPNDTFVNATPLAPGPATLETVNFDWLSGTPIALYYFIASVLGIPVVIVFYKPAVQSAVRITRRLAQPAVRRMRRRKPDLIRSAAASVGTVFNAYQAEEFSRAYGTITAPTHLQPAPRVRLRPGSYHGGAASTAAVEPDIDGYMQSMTSQPRPDTLSLRSGRWTAGTAVTP